jgi:hypothetical protein
MHATDFQKFAPVITPVKAPQDAAQTSKGRESPVFNITNQVSGQNSLLTG